MTSEKSVNNKYSFRQFCYDNRYAGAAALCACIITLLIAFCYDMFPFGETTILRMDMYHQYCPLFAEFYDRVTALRSFMYSWQSGMGSTFIGNFYNYLCSPSAVIVLLLGHKNVPEAIAAMIFAKSAFASASFTYYLRKSYGRNDFSTAGFGVLYCMCGWFIAYYWDVMWVDSMVFFPFVILGIEKIIKERKPVTFLVSLFLIFITNYYMSYMVCIFSVIYFLVYYFSNFGIAALDGKITKNEKGKIPFSKRFTNSVFLKSGFSFAFAGIGAAALAAFALVPVYFILQNCYATSDTFPESWKQYFTAFDFIANHFASVEPTIRSSGDDVLPNVYCGIATLVLMPLYYFSKKIALREKIANTVLLIVLYLSFNYNVISYIWHGFHYPSDLPYRFSFMYSFILLTMAYKAFLHISEYSGRQILGAGVAILFLMVFVQKVGSKNVDDLTLIISAAFLIVYLIVFYLCSSPKYQMHMQALSLLLMCCIVGEMVCANTDNYDIDQIKSHFAGDYKDFKVLQNSIESADEEKFYRSELTYNRARMAPSWYGYNGISTFTSMAYEDLSKLEDKLGLAGNNVDSYTYHMQTPVYNMMHGLKYIYDNDPNVYIDTDYYTYLEEKGDFTAYANHYYLPLAYSVNDDVLDWYTESGNPFSVQDQWFELASGEAGVLERMEINTDTVQLTNLDDISSGFESGYLYFNKQSPDESADITVTLMTEAQKHCYMYVNSDAIDSISITKNYANSDDGYNTTQYTDDPYIYDLGIIAPGDSVDVMMIINDDQSCGPVDFQCFSINQDALDAGFKTLGQNTIKFDSFSDSHFSGTINVPENNLIYTSVPYDKGWQVTLDGKRVSEENIIGLDNGLLCIKCAPGTHKLDMKFVQQGLLEGCVISLCALVIIIAVYILYTKFIRTKLKPVLTESEETVEDTVSDIPAEVLPTDMPVNISKSVPETAAVPEARKKAAQPESKKENKAVKTALSAAGLAAALALPAAYYRHIMRKDK